MKNTQIENKLETLKEMIRKMNSDAMGLINFSASVEISLRKNLSNTEIQNLEKELDILINQYTNPKEDKKMKHTINSIITSAVIAFVLCLAMGAHAYSNDNKNNGLNETTIIENHGESAISIITEGNVTVNSVKAARFIKSAPVKNIWNNMPSYDRYGNEITARARYNMLQNSLLNNKSAASNKEVK